MFCCIFSEIETFLLSFLTISVLSNSFKSTTNHRKIKAGIHYRDPPENYLGRIYPIKNPRGFLLTCITSIKNVYAETGVCPPYGTPFSKIRYSRLKRSKGEQLVGPQIYLLSIFEYSDGIISALSSDPHTPTFNCNSTCLTFQIENTFMLLYNPFLFLFRIAKSNFKNITPSYR